MTPSPAGTYALRLGWLDAFLSVAHHLDYEAAGNERGQHPASVRKIITHLESWLGRSLFFSEQGLLSIEPTFGKIFIVTATETLECFEAACRISRGNVPQHARANLRLADIRAFVSVAESGGYRHAADMANQTIGNIRRNIRSLERAMGRPLVTGRSRLTIHSDAFDFVETAKRMMSQLLSCRAREPNLEQYFEVFRQRGIDARRQLKINISVWKNRKRLSRIARRDLETCERKLQIIEKVLEDIGVDLDDRPTALATHIDMDEYYAEQGQRRRRDPAK